jgi:hypothetical protein
MTDTDKIKALVELEAELKGLLAEYLPENRTFKSYTRLEIILAAIEALKPLADGTHVVVPVAPINVLDTALCQYLNEVGDPFEPVEEWNSSCERARSALSVAYNKCHKEGVMDWNRKVKDIRTAFKTKEPT